MKKITIHGRDYDLCRNLDYDEFANIDHNLNFYKWIMFRITGKVKVTPQGDDELEVWAWRRDNDVRLCYPQGYEKRLSWDP